MRFFLLAGLICGCTTSNPLANQHDDDGGGVDGAMAELDLSVVPPVLNDLAQPPTDLSGVDLGGVACGSGQCPDGGAPAACDGPEDCPNGMATCCATVAGGTMSGMAECTADCPGSLMVTGGFAVRTRLCHSDADCAGYTGTFNGNSSAWDACCHQNANAGTHFCANSGFATFGGYTCP